MRHGLLLYCLLIIFFSCKTPEKEIRESLEPSSGVYKGKAVITSIVPAKMENGRESSEYFEIYFKFIPVESKKTAELDSSSLENQRIKLQYDNSTSFHRNWIEKWGIKTGNEYHGTRIEGKGKFTGMHIRYDVELKPAE